MPGRRPAPPNPAGAHFLHDRRLIRRLIRASAAGPGRLALDLGAGDGAITAALAATGARVIAVERDPRLAARLRHRVGDRPLVTVVDGDLREFPLPRREFLVVANIPFGVTTALLRRVVGDPAVSLAGAELVTAAGVARWLAAPVPRDAETAWWTARYRFRLAGPVPAASFTPPPSVAAAHLSVKPRPLAASASGQRLLRLLLRAAYRRPGLPLDDLLHQGVPARGAARQWLAGPLAPGCRRWLMNAGLPPGAPAVSLTGSQWHDLTVALSDAARRSNRAP